MKNLLYTGLFAILAASAIHAQNAPPAPHVQFITVDRAADKDVKLEVLDWGGTGRPLVLLTGLGNNAHVFDKFAPKLTPRYHVYGITRRGFGASSVPASGYTADRLADDVLAVIDLLRLNRPILVGHSIAGEELSSIGSRHPEKVAGLIYLDAAYSYAYYDASRGDLNIDLGELRKKLEQLTAGNQPRDIRPLVNELLNTSLPMFERDLRALQMSLPPVVPQTQTAQVPDAGALMYAGMQKYTAIHGPVLAIYANDDPGTEVQAKAFENGVPGAHVVRIPHANHYVFTSNEADVLREMNAFIATLP